jgi:hypothetical protein
MLSCFPAPDILGVGDGFEVIRVYAGWDPAKVVEFQSLGDRAVLEFVCDDVPISLALAVIDPGVSFVRATKPDQAPREGNRDAALLQDGSQFVIRPSPPAADDAAAGE